MSLIKHSMREIRKPCTNCDRRDLYWYHDSEVPGTFYCDEHSTDGKLVLCEKDGTRHLCRSQSGAYAPKPEANGSSNGHVPDDKLAVAAQLLEALSPKVDMATVKAMITEQHDAHASGLLAKVDKRISEITAPVTLEVKQNGEAKKIEGAHKVLPTITKIIGNARKHVLMVGPAGTGKSTIAEQVAEGLSLPYYSISLSPQTPASALLGYMQAAGEYVRSLYREAYEHGGIFHFDEFDNAHPSVLAVINASLANGQMAFPDGMVKRHPEFRACASANTYGRGPDRQYVGRQAIDAATLDRFVVVTVDVDEALEAKICHATGAAAGIVGEVLKYVRGLRANAERHKMSLMFSPRASEGMCSLIVAGVPLSEAIEYRVRRGISDADWTKVTSGVSYPHI